MVNIHFAIMISAIMISEALSLCFQVKSAILDIKYENGTTGEKDVCIEIREKCI